GGAPVLVPAGGEGSAAVVPRLAKAPVVGEVHPHPGAAAIVDGAAGGQQGPVPVVLAGFQCQTPLGLVSGRPGEAVDDAADGIGAVEGGTGAPGHLDGVRLGEVDLVEAVVVEEAGGPGGDAVLQEQVHPAGGQRLADGGHVALAPLVVDVYPGEA